MKPLEPGYTADLFRPLHSALDVPTARARAHVEGDESLALPFFRARSVMVTRPGASAESGRP